MENSQQPRFVGIDLGTSNSAVAAADDRGTVILNIEQKNSENSRLALGGLPSFIFIDQAGNTEAGEFAKQVAFEHPDRVIASAKSWLSVDADLQEQKILPWSSTISTKFSPVEATEILLTHIRKNSGLAESPEVVITVPASFHELARNLTLQAAQNSGLKTVTLLEEPLAALYSWLASSAESWRDQLSPGDLVLICDVGGGTTDFSLVKVNEQDGDLSLDRVAVGPHLLLGGDNIDLFLAYQIRQQLPQEISDRQFQSLLQLARSAKESLLSSDEKDFHLTLASEGSDLFAASISHTVDGDWLRETVVSSFFPMTAASDRPDESMTGLGEYGLPYATDPVITKHLSDFLQQAAAGTNDSAAFELVTISSEGNLTLAKPSHVLFNGGSTAAEVIQNRLLQNLESWLGSPVTLLTNPDHFTAVAKGAAYFHRLKSAGEGIKIKAATMNAFYLEIDGAGMPIPGVKPTKKAICLVPRGSEEGSTLELPHKTFALRPGEKRVFKFYSSGERSSDALGSFVDDPEQTLEAGFPLSASIDSDDSGQVQVGLSTEISELGVLRVSLNQIGSDKSWQLELDTRS